MRAAFYKGTRPGLHGVYNRAVRMWTRGPYSHCELVFGDGIAASASLMDGGVRMKRIEFDPAKWDMIALPWADDARARRWFIDRDGMPYDVLGNLRFVVPPLPDSPLRYFCSEAVLSALGFAEAWRFCPNGAHDILRTMELA